MSSSGDDRRRFARQIALPEIGEEGQARLAGVRAALPVDADRRAAAVAEAYLLRAGVRLAPPDEAEVIAPVPTTARVTAIAGDPSLLEAARSLTGALAAVEAMKRALGMGPEVPPNPPTLTSRGGES